jgi:lipopolysaccharide/colanic/teichoic acid biosynthesis glycosyltransferase
MLIGFCSESKSSRQIVRQDIQYMEEWTLRLGIKLILQTFWGVFAGKWAR